MKHLCEKYSVLTRLHHSLPVIRLSLMHKPAFVVAVCLLFPVMATADEHPFDIDHACAADIGAIGTCTANDIQIADASNAVTEAEYCMPGDMVEITMIQVDYELNASQRYDPLLWIGIEGNDPRTENAGSCYV